MAGHDAKTRDGGARFVSSYATGGGGVRFEHRYGALLLSHLLLSNPIDELGGDVTPISARFQASTESAVDDLLVKGRTVEAGERWLSIGVRHAPRLVASDASTRSLLAQYVRVVHDAWDRVREGGWRLALVVGTESGAIRELKALAEVAYGSPDRASFTMRIEDEVAVSARSRHDQLVTLARGAAADLELPVVLAEELLYRVLHVLRVRVARIEGGDTADLTSAIAALRRAVPDDDLAMAGALSDRLARLAERYAPAGAIVDEALLRRDLSGFPLRRSRSWAAAWRVLDRLADGLRAQTGSRLQSGERDLELPRATARDELIAAIRDVGSALVVHGEPDVGKSALTLRCGEALAESGAAVTRFSLRDLPTTTHELEALLGGTLHDVLAATAVADLRLLIIDGAEAVLEGRGSLLADLAAAAQEAGLGVVVVTRDDALAAVRRNLRALDAPPRDYAVGALTDDELDEVAAAFPSIRSLRRQPRGRGLLGRPGLVALLLRSGPGPAGPRERTQEGELVFRQFDAETHARLDATPPRRRACPVQSAPLDGRLRVGGPRPRGRSTVARRCSVVAASQAAGRRWAREQAGHRVPRVGAFGRRAHAHGLRSPALCARYSRRARALASLRDRCPLTDASASRKLVAVPEREPRAARAYAPDT